MPTRSNITGSHAGVPYSVSISLRDNGTGPRWGVDSRWQTVDIPYGRLDRFSREGVQEFLRSALAGLVLVSSERNGTFSLGQMPIPTRDRVVNFVTDYIMDGRRAVGCNCQQCLGGAEAEDEVEPPECVQCGGDHDTDDHVFEFVCDNCGWATDSDYDIGVYQIRQSADTRDTIPQQLCESCRSDTLAYCESCDSYINTMNTEFYWDYEECGWCSNGSGRDWVNEWDYRPQLIFHPMPPEKGKELYIGMELEVSFNRLRGNEGGYAWTTLLNPYDDLLYGKADSSVTNGFEVVTHPMNPDWAMEHFPFHVFQKGIEDYGLKLTHESTGTHIHMNKDAFSSAHLWKMLMVHDKLRDFCGIVGGRGKDASFGSFQRYSGDRNFLGVDRMRLLEIAMKKGKFDNPERYVAVNLRNEYTIELRYMRGGVAPKEIKKNIQWAKALYEFTAYLDVRDVREGALKNPGYLLWWISENRDTLPDLYDWIQKEIPQPVALRERSN